MEIFQGVQEGRILIGSISGYAERILVGVEQQAVAPVEAKSSRHRLIESSRRNDISLHYWCKPDAGSAQFASSIIR